MPTRQFTGNPSQIMVEQLAASGIKYVFNNSGSREAHFFDALHSRDDIHGILALHEGSVAAMAGGYTQVGLDPAAMVVHLGAGLAQCMGQLINVWDGSLPVVVITFAGDTGSFADRIILDLDHSFGPTSIAAPFTKANWTIIEPEGLPQAIDRAIRVAKTPPVGPVHLAVYDRLLGTQQVETRIIDGGVQDVRAGYPSDDDLEQIARALHEAERPMIYVGDGVWKSGAQEKVANLAERFGAAVTSSFGDLRAVPIKHRLHCGRIDQAAPALNPDLILCIGSTARRRRRGDRLRRVRVGREGHRDGRGPGQSAKRARSGPRDSGGRIPHAGATGGAAAERVHAAALRRPARVGAGPGRRAAGASADVRRPR